MAVIDRAPPPIVPGFRIVSELGRGGMGVVYEGWDEKLHRRVALKLLPAELAASPDLRERFLREARAAAALSHPHIAAIHAVEECEDGRPLLVMELIDGRSLRARLAGARLPLAEARAIALGIAEALAKAHAVGIVHRDLKPENVMVDEEGRAKLLDFGIAKALDRGPSLDTSGAGLTATGQVVGTAGYIAPEQVEGLPADQRVDVFAFGVVLFELLAGALPFDGATPVQRMVAVLRDPPVDLAAMAPEAPEALRELVLRCLSKRPEERPLDGSQLVLDLTQAWPVASGSGSSPVATSAHAPTEPHGSRPETGGRAGDDAGAGAAAGSGSRPLATPPAPQDPVADGIAGRSKRRRDRVIVAMCLVAGFATLLVLRMLRDEDPPRSEERRSASSRASSAPVDPEHGGIPTAFPCGERGGKETFETACSGDAIAWCDPRWERIACCAAGLVPHDAEGTCGCPPGGNAEDEPQRPGCSWEKLPRGLPAERMQEALRPTFPRAQACYEASLAKVPNAGGSMSIALRLAPNGKVFSARVAESSLADPEVQRCVVDVLRQIPFPPPRGTRGVEITYPLYFSP